MWNFISKRKAIKKYSPENDKSRKGGVLYNGEIRTAEQGIDSEPDNLVRHEQPERREFLQEAVTSDVGKNSPSTGKNIRSAKRRFFRRK